MRSSVLSVGVVMGVLLGVVGYIVFRGVGGL